MKNSNLLNQILEKFTNWLRNHYTKADDTKFKSAYNYGRYMRMALADLNINIEQFAKIQQPGILKSILKSLTASTLFKGRDEKIQSDIISGFKAYINFVTAIQKFA